MKLLQLGGLALGALMALPSAGDQLLPDDTIVQSNVCVGFDCVNGESFSSGPLKLKENNLRLRLYDTSAVAAETVRQTFPNAYVEGDVGESWRLEANQSANGGRNDFYITQVSIDPYTVLSDGTAPDYDCSDPLVVPRPIVGTIPEGMPTEDSSNCQTTSTHVQRDALVFTGTDGGGVAVGSGTDPVDGLVALGSADTRQRLVHVARALAESDVLIKVQLDEGLLHDQHRRLNDIEALLTMAEEQIVLLEASVEVEEDQQASSSGGSGAMGWLMVLLPMLAIAVGRRSKVPTGS
ncbi:hypothetical protein [Marinobacter sp. LN3S78]|uniref:hypothetical protein n=1 Tax=Marinobacter sp. LN3S78 TaxID=3382300 RepID=UPI00387AB931